jgi:diacylglycerol kinase
MTKVSFRDSALCATRGLFHSVSSERSIKIQLIIGFIITFCTIAIGISKTYLITIIVVYFLVIILEMFNRGFEKLIDLVSPGYNKEFGRVKDVMAGVVLLTFIMAVTVSFLILYAPIVATFKSLQENPLLLSLMIANVLLIPIVILVEHKKNNRNNGNFKSLKK